MGKLVISENMSIDGVIQDPTGEEGLGYGSWTGLTGDDDRQAWAGLLADEAVAAQALLLGRRSDQWFADRWRARTGPWADRLNSMPKFVVSATLKEPRWGNGTVLGGDPAEAVAALKRQVDGDIVLYGSIQLARTLLEHDLVDELRLIVYPVVLGTGGRLFDAAGGKKRMHLVEARVLGTGLAFQVYQRAAADLSGA
jgi:dihydrofolate reductase